MTLTDNLPWHCITNWPYDIIIDCAGSWIHHVICHLHLKKILHKLTINIYLENNLGQIRVKPRKIKWNCLCRLQKARIFKFYFCRSKKNSLKLVCHHYTSVSDMLPKKYKDLAQGGYYTWLLYYRSKEKFKKPGKRSNIFCEIILKYLQAKKPSKT